MPFKNERDAINFLYRNNLSLFAQRAWHVLEGKPYAHNWHFDCIAEHLEWVERGDIKRLMVWVPPRTLKTYLANICFTGWALGRDPFKKIVGVSFSHRLSEKIAFRSRVLIESDWYRSVFPETIIDKNQAQKANYVTTKGGGRFSTSVGGTMTGEGGNILIFDDPMDPAQAGSDIKRDATNDWIDNTMHSRLNDPQNDAMVCIMQRVHPKDTAAHLIEQENWHILKLPAETNNKITITLGDHKWEYKGLLHPERVTEEVLNRHKKRPYIYNSQYLQDPKPQSGGLFNQDLLHYFKTYEFDVTKCNIYITVDPATSKKKDSDYTAMAVWALAPDHNFYLIDGVKERLNPTERLNKLFELHRKWNEKRGKPPKVGYEEYGLSSDIHYIKQKQDDENYRFSIEKINPRMNKEERITRLVSIMADERMWLPNDIYIKDDKGLSKPFINDIIQEEMLLFPYAPHDDFIDAMAMIFDMNPIFPKFTPIDVKYDYLPERDMIDVLEM